MVLLSLHRLAPALIAKPLERVPVTVRRWIGRFNTRGVTGLADHPRCGRPRLGGNRLRARITALFKPSEPWTVLRLYWYLGWSHLSQWMLYRRVRQVAVWRRPS